MKRSPLLHLGAIALLSMLSACGAPASPTPLPTPRSPTLAPTAPPPTATKAPTAMPTPTSTSTPTVTPTATPCRTLRECADRKQIQIGNYLGRSSVFHNNVYRQITAREFNLAVISAGFYWRDVEATRGQFDFAYADEQVAFAQANNMMMVGHALLLAEPDYIPDWLAKGNFTKDELAQLLRTFITQVMTRYKGKIGWYLVVEDAPIPPDTQRDVFYPKFGYDYVDLAFQIARETDPSAVLIYNANENETSDGRATQLTRQIIQRLKAKGLVDGVGLEMHLDAAKPYTKQDVIATMKSYGVPVYVTEIDVDLTHVEGTLEETFAKQAKIFGDMFAACLESGMCKSYALWGIGDRYSWLRAGSATAFDDSLEPKPAYFALMEVLR